MARPKPKWGWESGGPLPFKPFKEDDFQKIADALKVSALSEELRSQLVEATQKYFMHRNSLNERPRRAELNAGLEDIYKKAKALTDCLKQLDGATREKMMIAYTAPAKEMLSNEEIERDEEIEREEQIGREEEIERENKHWEEAMRTQSVTPSSTLTTSEFLTMIKRCKSDAYKISWSAKRARSNLKNLPLDKGGPRPNLALKSYIGELAEIYEQATGKKAGIPYKKSKDTVIYVTKTKKDIKVTKQVMDEKSVRRCRICHKPLSEYNKNDICFCHSEHPTNGESNSKKTLNDETAEQMPDEIKIPEGPFLRFVACVFQAINPSITKSTLFSAIKSALKNTS